LVKVRTHPLCNLDKNYFLQNMTVMEKSNQSGEVCRVIIMSIPLDKLPTILGKEGRKISQIRSKVPSSLITQEFLVRATNFSIVCLSGAFNFPFHRCNRT
jgi:hypothetical protein